MIDQRTAPWAALLLRVTLGSLFIAHLYWKFAILPGGLNAWWSNFAKNGYSSITPWYCISAELRVRSYLFRVFGRVGSRCTLSL